MNSTATRRPRPMGHEIHHGRTAAAWTASMLALVGFIVLCAGMLMGPAGFPSVNWNLVIAGAVILLVAPLVGGIMNRLGMGQD